MQQLTQKLKSGKMTILEAPIPSLQRGYLLVNNHYSLITVPVQKEVLLRPQGRDISVAIPDCTQNALK